MGGQRGPGHDADGEGGRPGAAARDARDEEPGQDGRYGTDGVHQRSGQPRQQPQQQPGDEGGGTHRDRRAEGVQRAVGDTGEDVPAQRVRPERVGRGGGLQPGEGVQGERVARQAEADDRGEQRPVQQRQGAGRGRGRPVQGGQGAVAQRGPDQQPRREPGEDAGGGREQDQGERAGLEDGQVLGERGVQGEPAQAGDVEDLLDGDRTAGQTDHEQAQVGQQPGHTAAHRLPRHSLRRDTAGRGGQRPGFGERAGQQVVEHPSEHRAGGQAEGQ